MIFEYNMQPNKEIYGCVTNVLACAGRLRKAFDLIDTMPFALDESVWGALLGSLQDAKECGAGQISWKQNYRD